MQYRIRLIQSEEGWAVSCPALTGCHSQGATREEAVENIKLAIHEFFRVVVAFRLGRRGVGRVPTVGSNQFCVIWL